MALCLLVITEMSLQQSQHDLKELTIRVELITSLFKVAIVGEREGYACCCRDVEGKVDWVRKVLPRPASDHANAQCSSQLTSPVSTAPLPEDQVPAMLETLFAVVKSCCARMAAGAARSERNAKFEIADFILELRT